jgi:GNAT superfamily N-acetyltransferase
MCQSVAKPSGLEYSHIGDTVTRFLSVTSRSRKGVNRAEDMSHDIMNRMLTASRTLAARIERAECDTVLAFARQLAAGGTDVLIHEIGGASAVFAGAGQPINKLAGLGFAAGVDETSLAALERAFDARAADLRVELATLADPAVGIHLTRRGYELVGYENVLGLPLSADIIDGLARAHDADVKGGVLISRAHEDEARTCIETVADGFSCPDQFDGPPPTESFERQAMVDAFSAATATPGMTLYLARRDGAIAGGGATRISNQLAQLAGAATLPAHRRRGVQSALLRARLLDAARQGCDLAIVTTEPGSKSQENVQRAGFALLYSRAVLVRRRTVNC